MGKSTLLKKVLNVMLVNRIRNHLRQARLHVLPLAVSDRLDKQFAQRAPLELELSEHIEDLSAKGLACLFKFFKQCVVNVALAGLAGHEIPEMADLGLADSMNAAKSLLYTIRIPGKIVVHHQVRALKVDSFACGIGRDENLRFRIELECLLSIEAVFTAHATMNHDNSIGATKQAAYLVLKVGEGIAVLCEDDELLTGRRFDAVRSSSASSAGSLEFDVSRGCRRENLVQEIGQLAPFAILSAPADFGGPCFQPAEGRNLRFQFFNSSRGCRLVEELLLSYFDLRVGCIFQILHVIWIKNGTSKARRIPHASALQYLKLSQAALEAVAPSTQRLIDRLWRRGESALQDREREPDGASLFFVCEGLGAVKLVSNVIRDLFVKLSLGI